MEAKPDIVLDRVKFYINTIQADTVISAHNLRELLIGLHFVSGTLYKENQMLKKTVSEQAEKIKSLEQKLQSFDELTEKVKKLEQTLGQK